MEPVKIGYRLYIRDGHGRFGKVHELECASDDEAVEACVKYIDGAAMELWRGSTFVKHFPKRSD